MFISPKQRQKMFFMGITIMLLLFLAAVSLLVFVLPPKNNLPALTFNKPKVNIDLSIFNSSQFKSLQSFPQITIQYSYTATTKNNKPRTGFISATSIDEARVALEGMGLSISELKEVEIGRDNPFTPYYQQVVTPTKKK